MVWDTGEARILTPTVDSLTFPARLKVFILAPSKNRTSRCSLPIKFFTPKLAISTIIVLLAMVTAQLRMPFAMLVYKSILCVWLALPTDLYSEPFQIHFEVGWAERGEDVDWDVFHRAIPQAESTARLRLTHRHRATTRDWYYVRVRQTNDQWAWRSSIWVEPQ